MTSLAWLIPAALLLGGLGLAAFLWSLNARQYDDLEGPAWRILFDDEPRARTGDEGEPVNVDEGSTGGKDSPKSGAAPPSGTSTGHGPERDGL